jgi:hypothetical protein
MRVTGRRCTNCGVKYAYWISGSGAPEYNDGKWCQSCAKAVSETLKLIPRRFERRFRPVLEMAEFFHVSIETLKEWAKLDFEASAQANYPIPGMRRVFPGLFAMKDGQIVAARHTEQVNGYGDHRTYVFQFHEWSDGREPPEVTVEMEWDVQNNRWSTKAESNGMVFPVAW